MDGGTGSYPIPQYRVQNPSPREENISPIGFVCATRFSLKAAFCTTPHRALFYVGNFSNSNNLQEESMQTSGTQSFRELCLVFPRQGEIVTCGAVNSQGGQCTHNFTYQKPGPCLISQCHRQMPCTNLIFPEHKEIKNSHSLSFGSRNTGTWSLPILSASY